MKPLLLLSLLAGCAAAQESFTLEWSTLDGGGGRSNQAGEFTLQGSSVGQIEAGSSSGAGEYSLAGGFWTFPCEPALPELTMSLDGTTVTLTWAVPARPVVLQSSGDLELWETVDPQPVMPFFQEAEGERKYYRLVSP